MDQLRIDSGELFPSHAARQREGNLARFLDGATLNRAHAAIGALITNSGFLERTLAFFVKALTGREPKPGAARSVTILTNYLKEHHPENLTEWQNIAASIRASRELRNAMAHSYVEIASSIDDEGVPLVILKRNVVDAGQRVTLDEIDALNASLLSDHEAALRVLANIALKGAQPPQ